MTPSTEVGNRTVPAVSNAGQPARGGLWSKVKLVVRRAVFWSYERGSWQYDVIVAVILAFIFLTPRSWFHKAPTLGLSDLRHVQGVIEVSHQKDEWTYLVDARLVQARQPEPPDQAVRAILSESLHRQFTTISVDTIQDKNGILLGYKVVASQ